MLNFRFFGPLISWIYSIRRWIKCGLSDWSLLFAIVWFSILAFCYIKPVSRSSWAKNTIEHTKASYLEGIALILRRLKTIDFIRCGEREERGEAGKVWCWNVYQTHTMWGMIYHLNITQAVWRHSNSLKGPFRAETFAFIHDGERLEL